jgi:hypothetical protein
MHVISYVEDRTSVKTFYVAPPKVAKERKEVIAPNFANVKTALPAGINQDQVHFAYTPKRLTFE